jgi:hypothetical protein
MIWGHLAGDTSLRLKAFSKLDQGIGLEKVKT